MQSLQDSGVPEPAKNETPSNAVTDEVSNSGRSAAVTSALRCFDSVLAFLAPLVYGLLYGQDTSWHWTALYSWLWFFICHPVDKSKIMCTLIVWSVLAFVFWMIIFAVTHATALIYVGVYFLLNGLLLFAVALRSICQRRDRDSYESI